jgi:glycosyltransferase involved in cell wall biosynthesis
MRILFLYSEYVNYLDGLMKVLARDFGVIIKVVCWDNNLLKPMTTPEIDGVSFVKRSDVSVSGIVSILEGFNPSIVYISGWMDSGYLKALNKAKNRRGFTTVCGFDDNWHGTFRQRFGALYFKIFLRKHFDKAWVAGCRQYYYARQFGYKDRDIAFNLLSCNTLRFDQRVNRFSCKKKNSPRFFYVGNFREVKGTDLLAKAFTLYRDEFGGNGELTCIGQGPLRRYLQETCGIAVLPYMSSQELIELAHEFDVFVLPSRRDQWGVALHEFALLGFPIISSFGTGATERFLIDGYNGFIFDSNDVRDLARTMKKFDEISIEELALFGARSRNLGLSITSETSAASLLSLSN